MSSIITPELRTRIRAAFPALRSETVFLENAGGSQVPALVADRVHEYLTSTYVQLGAGYALSTTCTETVDTAHRLVSTLMNGDDGHVILGSSTSALLRMLSDCYTDVLPEGSEIIVAETGHEANVGPWTRLDRLGHKIHWWRMDPDTFECPLDGLRDLLTERTALVAFPHVSNLLGDIVDVAAATSIAHEAGARVVVDGVAYAPHRAIDVAAWDVDWYGYSTYKVYGPHMGALYGKADAVAELTGPNHFFVPRDEIPYKFELGGASHEGCAAILGLADYLTFLSGIADATTTGARSPRSDVEQAFEIMTACEIPLQQQLLGYLREKPGVRVIGPGADGESRVGTISFVHEKRSSAEIATAAHAQNIGIRNGHMYAYHLCLAAGLDPEDGVVRTSFVHYNTPEEVDRLIDVFETVL